MPPQTFTAIIVQHFKLFDQALLDIVSTKCENDTALNRFCDYHIWACACDMIAGNCKIEIFGNFVHGLKLH